MKKTVSVLGIVGTALLLSACPSEKKNEPSAQERLQAACNHAAVLPDVRENIRQLIRSEAQRFAAADNRGYIDPDKVTAAADRLQVRLSAAKNDGKLCSAQVSVIVPQAVLDTAEANAPLLNVASPAEVILLRTADNNLRFDGQAMMGQLRYSVKDPDHAFAVNYADSTLSQLGSILASALLPYGVQEVIVMNNRPLSRKDALSSLHEAKQQNVAPSKPSMPKEADTLTPQVPEVQTTPRRRETADEGQTLTAQDEPAPVIDGTEEAAAPPPNRVSDEKLNQARNAHQSADRDIKSAWRNIDPSIQQTLVDEQREWEKSKNQSCRKAAAKGGDDSESQYLYMQCDTRETKKRIRNLEGYSIQ